MRNPPFETPQASRRLSREQVELRWAEVDHLRLGCRSLFETGDT